MINTDTVFVLGAGASCPYCYPSGEKLRIGICNNFSNDLRQLLQKEAEWTKRVLHDLIVEAERFTKIFYESGTRSIDLFLSRNLKYANLGRMAIILRILFSERDSLFNENVKDKSQDWYSYFFNMITDNIFNSNHIDIFRSNAVRILTFNYDRSLEYFLFKSLTNSFSEITKEIIANVLQSLNIIHIYGIIQKLPWQMNFQREHLFDYKGRLDYNLLNNFTKNILLIQDREKINNDDIIYEISHTNRIFFLGFGYAEENMSILGIPEFVKNDHLIFGTAQGCSEKEINDIKNKYFSKVDPTNIHIENCDCLRLLRDYL